MESDPLELELPPLGMGCAPLGELFTRVSEDTAQETLDAAWAPVQSVRELHSDPQVRANEYLTSVEAADGSHYDLVSNPCQFDESVPRLRPAPEIAAHTEEVLLALGLGWDEISRHREAGAI